MIGLLLCSPTEGFAAGYHFNERRGELLALLARRREHQRIERQQVESIYGRSA
jgi:hypothetical protein